MYRSLGLTAATLEVYRALLATPSWTPSEAALLTGTDVQELAPVLAELAELGMTRPALDGSDRFSTISPQIALGRLMALAEKGVEVQQRDLAVVRANVEAFAEEYRALREMQSGTRMEVLDGRESVRTRIAELASAAQEEVLAFVTSTPSREALAHAKTGDRALLARGASIRLIALTATRRSPQVAAYARWHVAEGASIRVTPSLPVRLLIYDGKTAVVAQQADDPGKGAVVLRGHGTLAALTALFETYWEQSESFFESGPAPERPVLDPTERVVIELLAKGAKDDAVARHLGVSVRTVRRMLSDLSHRVGAGSRFELAVLAGRNDWV